MDFHNRYWNHRRLRSHGCVLSAQLSIAVIIGYLLNQLLLKRLTQSWILHWYLNDFLAIVLLLAFANILMFIFAPYPVWRNNWLFFVIAVFAAIYWEFITPMYAESVTDPFDLLAYALGSIFFVLFSRRSRSKSI